MGAQSPEPFFSFSFHKFIQHINDSIGGVSVAKKPAHGLREITVLTPAIALPAFDRGVNCGWIGTDYDVAAGLDRFHPFSLAA